MWIRFQISFDPVDFFIFKSGIIEDERIATANGKIGHEQTRLRIKPVEENFTKQSMQLIKGFKVRINEEITITGSKTSGDFINFVEACQSL